MIKERIKSCLLVFLIVSSIVLTLNMWFGRKLWSDGYNFFSNITNFFDSQNKVYYLSKENISYPQKIIITNNEKRNLYTHTSTKYNKIVPTVMDVFKTSIAEYEFVKTDIAEWNNALHGKCAYVSYPVVYDASLLWGILDIAPISEGAINVKDFIINISEKGDESISIYIKDHSTNEIYKTNLAYGFKNISEIIQNYALDSINLLPYSFELNFDKPSQEKVTQKITLEPTVILPLESLVLPVIETINFAEDIYNNHDLSAKILSSFNYNTTNSRKYLDANNTAVFVENYSTIKVHENGLLEYKALDNTKGISLADSNSATQHDIFIACIEFVNNLWDNTFPDQELSINLTSDIAANGKSFYITMDYYVEGYQLISRIDTNNIHNELKHGIEITVTEGKIVEYRQLFNTFNITDKGFANGSSIDAIDRMFADNIIESGTISELNTAYERNGNLWYPTWYARTTNGENILIRR